MDLNIKVDALDRQIQQWLTNKYVSQAMTVGLVIYAVLVAPRLSREMASIIDNPVVKMIVFFIIAYMATKDYKIAVSLVVAYVITMQTCEKHRMNDKLVSAIVSDQVAAAKKSDIVVPIEQSVEVPAEAVTETMIKQSIVVPEEISPEEEVEVAALLQEEAVRATMEESEVGNVPVDEVDVGAVMDNDPVAAVGVGCDAPLEGFGNLTAFSAGRGGMSSMSL